MGAANEHQLWEHTSMGAGLPPMEMNICTGSYYRAILWLLGLLLSSLTKRTITHMGLNKWSMGLLQNNTIQQVKWIH